jgi:hypothetical protein
MAGKRGKKRRKNDHSPFRTKPIGDSSVPRVFREAFLVLSGAVFIEIRDRFRFHFFLVRGGRFIICRKTAEHVVRKFLPGRTSYRHYRSRII